MNTLDKYAQAFADAMKRAGVRNTVVSTHVGTVGNNCIAQWKTGRRKIPANHAPKVAVLLGVPPEIISESYDRLKKVGALLPQANGHDDQKLPPSHHIVLSQLEDFGRAEDQDRIWLPESVSKRKLGLTRPDDVRWTLQHSRSMEPEIERQALVLIDITAQQQEDVVDGGLYAYALWGRPDIRRIQIRRGVWTFIGANPGVERVDVPDDELAELRVFGAVIGWI
jgi:DNA-binding transcriptional regulator YdaS (Cro superfamily)